MPARAFVAATATPTASSTAARKPSDASSAVAGSAVAMSVSTLAPLCSEVPRSPVRKPAAECHSCTQIGWSAP